MACQVVRNKHGSGYPRLTWTRPGGWPVGGGAQRANCAAPERAGTDRRRQQRHFIAEPEKRPVEPSFARRKPPKSGFCPTGIVLPWMKSGFLTTKTKIITWMRPGGRTRPLRCFAIRGLSSAYLALQHEDNHYDIRVTSALHVSLSTVGSAVIGSVAIQWS